MVEYEYGITTYYKCTTEIHHWVVICRDVYKVYLDFLPKQKTFDKYIKGNKGKYNKECLEYLSQWYGVSQREVMDYLEILSKDDVINILMKYGLTDKRLKSY